MARQPGIVIENKKGYIFKRYPDDRVEFMQDAGRWVVTAKVGHYRETIGTGQTEPGAWQSAYKFAQETVAPKTDDPNDMVILTKDKIKPVNSSPKFKPYSQPMQLKPMLLPKKSDMLPEEDFEPIAVEKNKTTPMTFRANLADQTLVQHIGVASNCNVILQHAFSTKGVFYRKIRLVCKKCCGEKVYFDEVAFHLTPDGIKEELRSFCYSHRHDGSKGPPVFVPKQDVVPENYRRFRED